MTRENFVGTASHNGNPGHSGAGCGFKIGISDRDRFFDGSWQTVTLRLAAQGPTHFTEVNCAKASFWNGTCRELIGKEIGRCLIDNGFASGLGERRHASGFCQSKPAYSTSPLSAIDRCATGHVNIDRLPERPGGKS